MPRTNLRLQAAVPTLHLWIGVAAGVLFCLMSLSGSLIVFRADIEKALRPRWTATSAARPAAVLTEAARNIRKRWPDEKIVALSIPPAMGDPDEFDIRLPDGRSAHVFTDGRSGEVLGIFDLPWLDWIVDLHHNLHLGPSGKQVVGVVGIGLFCASLTGLTLCLLRKPNWRKALRIRTGGSWKLVNFDLHRTTGLLANVMLLILSATGIYLAFPVTIQSTFGVARAKTLRRMNDSKDAEEAKSGESKRIEELIAAAQQAVPGSSVRQMRFGDNTRRPITVGLWAPGDFRIEGSNRVTLDAYTARVLQADRASDWSPMRRVTESAAPVHYAEWGGPVPRVLWAFTGFAPLVLFISGFLIWLQPYLARRAAGRRVRAKSAISAEEVVR